MKKIYQNLWTLAEPYYRKGRPIDIDHVKILIADALIVCQKENIDESLLLPLVILHDIGYGDTETVYLEKELKKEHMTVGAELAKEILEKVSYPKEKIDKIVYWISVHDNWIFDDYKVYKNDPLLAVFHDLEFIWMTTSKGFLLLAKTLFDDDKQAMLQHIKNDYKKKKKSFSTKTTEKLYLKYIKARENELQI